MIKDENEDPSLAKKSGREGGGGGGRPVERNMHARGLITCGLEFYAHFV